MHAWIEFELVFGTQTSLDLSIYRMLCFKEIRVSPKNYGISFWKFVPNSGLRKFEKIAYTIVEYNTQVTVVDLLLITLDDSGHGQLLSTVDT